MQGARLSADGAPSLRKVDSAGKAVRPAPWRAERMEPVRVRVLGGGGALLMLLVAGCAGVGSERVRQDLLAGRSQGRYLAGVPFVPQADRYCGPASLAMVLRYWGAAADQEEIGAALYLPSAMGTLNLDLEFYARRRGFRAEGFRGTLAQVKAEIDHGRPVIVFQDQGIGPLAFPHFLVVIGYDEPRELILAHSGVTENRLIPYREFLWTWGKTGNWTLRVQPGDRSSAPRGAPAGETVVTTGWRARQRDVTEGRDP